jgi:hypothetical protein
VRLEVHQDGLTRYGFGPSGTVTTRGR